MARTLSPPPSGPPAAPRRWLMLVHLLPASPSNLRVRTWRRLQELGAVPLKQSVYVLPDSPEAREDFEWLKVEIEGSGGQASVFAADALDAAADADLVEAFKRVRQSAYAELAADLQRYKKPAGKSSRRGAGARDHLQPYRQRLAAIERVDFFSSAGRDKVIALLGEIEGRTATPAGAPLSGKSKQYLNRSWVTRPRPGVDRMGSAWLIRRFIDPAARFVFATQVKGAPSGAVSFDMFGGDFTHRGQACTFEVLCAAFAIDDPAVARLGRVIHDLDLKDDHFGEPEAPTVGAAIDGLQLSCPDDHALLEQGMTLFEALYRSFAQPAAARSAATHRRRAARRPSRRRST